MVHHDQLREKGWSEEELQHLQKHFSPGKESGFLMGMLASLLLFAVFGVPYAYSVLAQIIPSQLLYSVVLLVGVALGASFGVLLTDIDRLVHKHHVVLACIIPILCIVGLFVSMKLVNSGLFAHNAYIASVLYGFGFVVPYGVLIKHRWNLKKQ